MQNSLSWSYFLSLVVIQLIINNQELLSSLFNRTFQLVIISLVNHVGCLRVSQN